MQDRPTQSEIVEAVREFLKGQVAPQLEGHTAFHMRVTLNLLGILQRELDEGPAADERETARLLELLGQQPGDLHDLNEKLAAEIRAGDWDAPEKRAALVDHLKATVKDKLAIANPKYPRVDEL